SGCNGPATTTHVVTTTPTVTINAFAPATSTRCQGAGTVTTTTTASNSTGITYSIDATSIAGGVTIVAGTGAVTYPAGWSGTTTITASASGCNGPATTTHVVTTTPTVTINAFAPATSTRCQGAGTVTTTTTASNSTGITYSIDATSIAGGVTIVAGTGAVTYPAGWSGTTTITASAAGCNGPATTTHVVTINPLPSAAGAISGTASVCKNQVGYVYTISAIPNATSYVWAYSGSNATITNNGTSATIDFGNSTSGNLTVYGTNSCGNGVSATFAIATSNCVQPSLSASTLTNFGNICVNTVAGPNSFTITGTSLTAANVTVGALSGFTYSTAIGGPYTTSLSLVQPGGSYSQIIYVQFNPTLAQSYNGNISVGGGGAPTITVAVVGSGVNPPTTATVGATQNICGSLVSASLGGNTPSTGTGLWSIVSGGTGTFSSSSSGTSTFTANAY
ncbi:MAG: hypothetical protein ACK457_03295, partial [Flavobacteriia bacterium]